MEWPLHEAYHRGPWFLGAWEGEALPRICARITFHGDEAFWGRNLFECERIFRAKEEAWLRLARPIVGLGVAVFVVWALRLWMVAWKQLQQQRARDRQGPVDREIIDFYHAFNAVARQIHRVTAEAKPVLQQQQRPR